MVKIEKKQIVHSIKQQHEQLKKIYNNVENICLKNKKLQHIKKDIDNFLSDIDEQKINCNISTVEQENYILFFWNEEKYSLNIKFFGEGYWEYILIEKTNLGIKEISFKGSAYRFLIKNVQHFLFLLDEEILKFIKIEEEYSYNYEPMYKLSENNKFKIIKYGWHTRRYDGILSGYCYLKKELHYFDLKEEKDYSGDRCYAIYKLTLIDKIKAYYNHSKFYFIIKKIKDLFNIKINYKKHSENHEKWKAEKEIVGFFEF